MAIMEELERYYPTSEEGLTDEQVRERVAAGRVNEYTSNTTKSYGRILWEHLFTFFNILNIVLLVLLLAVGAYKDLVFMIIVVANFLVGVIQEFSAKRTLDKLSLIVAACVRVIRSGKKHTVRVGEIVLDDVMELVAGNQIAADATVLSGYLEVNESLISGESDVIIKRPGDFLYSGSFVVSGNARAQVEHIGADNYANQISKSAKEQKKRKSELYSTLGTILRVISYIIIPVGVMLFYKQNVILNLLPEEAVVKTVAGLIGMIPEGLILMTSIAFVGSVIFLAHDHTLVQDMYGIETLARVDVICLDKTGTLTEGKIAFQNIIPLTDVDATTALCNICGASQDENATMTAIRQQFPAAHDWKPEALVPFSSERKYSGVCFANEGTYMLGAAEFLFPQDEALKEREAEIAEDGGRVVLLAHSDATLQENEIPSGLCPLAFLLLSDNVRKDTKDTLEYFDRYDVEIKIISGDHPKTVAHIAQQSGVKNAERYVDASTLETEEQLSQALVEYSVFGRVSPAQKKQMVALMKQQGKKVAMMGDGVNDVLALKEADCSVAVASGSDAAKNVSDIVLMDSNLKHLLHVVEDGRKIINNIQRVATLFISKTVYSVLLALATLFLFESAYPFTPLQLVVTSFVTIGAPSFFLALEPQYDRVKGKFIRNVLGRSLPGGLTITVAIILINYLVPLLAATPDELAAMCVYLAVAGGMWVLVKVSVPFTWIRRTVLIGMIGLFTIGVIFMHDFFEISAITPWQIVAVAVLCGVMPLLMMFFEWLARKMFAWMEKRKTGKKMLHKLNSMDG
ncbi:cation-translocating P-type ATPase [Christensenellaceae bacterium OttesenSCG-928-K19]|nr:cation-translocating P-type ATPase [Christensenellaceae bacterium OttesenSCG-928-K19]